MTQHSPQQIYGFARQAGFSPDQSATMTAIALAESSGRSTAHNPYGEDSRGLWQINAAAHPDLATTDDLFEPFANARAAFEVSMHGNDISPWTTTHGGLSARYLRFREQAEAAAVAYGDGPGLGVWTGSAAYGDRTSAGHGESSSQPVTSTTASDAAGSMSSAVLEQREDRGILAAIGASDDDRATADGAGERGILAAVTDAGTAPENPGAQDQPDQASPDGAGGEVVSPEVVSPDVVNANLVTPAVAVENRPPERGVLAAVADGQVGTDGLLPDSGSGRGILAAVGGPPDREREADAGVPEVGTPPGPTTQKFVDVALGQTGDPYVFGVSAALDNRNPSAFDCSELTRWAAHQVGVEIPDGTWLQYLELKQSGDTMSVEEAIHTKGALLFAFSEEPTPGSDRPSLAHVAISLGDGTTIEAKGTRYGVGSWEATPDRFQYAATIPGLTAGAPAASMVEVSTSDVTTAGIPMSAGPWSDLDKDGFSDSFERRVGLDPHRMDSDRDGLSDTEELLRFGTDPRLADSNWDGVPDADEVRSDDDEVDGDADDDGFADWLERDYGSNPDDPTEAPPTPDAWSDDGGAPT